ncbi:Tyrosine-protein kinase receptor Tie-1 [Holothuria leucospilota]|uniref:Tyrosine-protein kinase receptor Tie-1 n=1 Tax=Holothuria leucospilota TaxID=206669 RepID=A0A9Q1HD31_HOLLE|nr:Tyrosine-protein kinase receptor Tie-1 [Holothuria leucospilota]
MTLLSLNHYNSEVDSEYQCYLSDDDSNRNGITTESMRTGWTRDTAEENPEPPVPLWHSDKLPHYKVAMINNGTNDAFGVFGCKATKPGKLETSISTTRMRSGAVIEPSNELFTQTVNVNDTNVSIGMKLSTGTDQWNLRWQHNNGDIMSKGTSTFYIEGPIQFNDSGIYECYIKDERHRAKHGLNLLLVRACPATRWGPPDCLGVCESCYNGGVCDENNGKCVCPPGFKGLNCLEGW